MKTNQVMTRQMGNFEILQRTKDGMFNATLLLKQWNDQSVSNRKLDNYFNSEKTKEFIQTIQERENLDTPKMVYVKSKASRGDSVGTWMHPLLFIDFAMWINPKFKYDVLKFVSGQMIKYRNEAGDAYRELSAAVQKIAGNNMKATMKTTARAINHVVFGSHEHMIRNKQGDEAKQYELLALERKLADLINDDLYVKPIVFWLICVRNGMKSTLLKSYDNKSGICRFYKTKALWEIL